MVKPSAYFDLLSVKNLLLLFYWYNQVDFHSLALFEQDNMVLTNDVHKVHNPYLYLVQKGKKQKELLYISIYLCKSSVVLLTDIFYLKNYSRDGHQKVSLDASHYLVVLLLNKNNVRTQHSKVNSHNHDQHDCQVQGRQGSSGLSIYLQHILFEQVFTVHWKAIDFFL